MGYLDWFIGLGEQIDDWCVVQVYIVCVQFFEYQLVVVFGCVGVQDQVQGEVVVGVGCDWFEVQIDEFEFFWVGEQFGEQVIGWM